MRHVFEIHSDFRCKFCAAILEGNVRVKAHLEDDHTKNTCPICFKLVDRSNAKSHAESHFTTAKYKCSPTYVCPLCNYPSSSESQFSYHMKAVHLYGNADLRQCPVCTYMDPKRRDASGELSDALMSHIIRTHLDAKPLKCPMCSHGIFSKGAHLNHVKSHSIKTCCICKTDPMKISLCNIWSWEQHITAHASECPLIPVCPLCKIHVSNSDILKSHISTQHAEPIVHSRRNHKEGRPPRQKLKKCESDETEEKQSHGSMIDASDSDSEADSVMTEPDQDNITSELDSMYWKQTNQHKSYTKIGGMNIESTGHWKCKLCVTTFNEKKCILQHILTEHIKRSDPTCIICNTEVQWNEEALKHILSHAGMQCALCSLEGIPTLNDLDQHLNGNIQRLNSALSANMT